MMKVETKSETKKISVNDFSTLNLSEKNSASNLEGVKIYNFNCANGSLQKGLGVRNLNVYMGNDANSETYELDYQSIGLEYINKVMYFKQYFPSSGNTAHRLLIHGSDNKLYIYQMYSGLNMINWTYQLSFETTPVVLEYKKDGLDSILISASDKLIVWSTGRTPYELTNVPTITSMCIHNDVLYCTIAGETDKIWYTQNLNPESVGTESDTTKYLLLSDERGACRKVVTFKENVYIFRDYGISRLNDYKDTPTYNQIYLSDTKIYANTIAVCGEYIVFITRDGIYKFNGASVSKVNALPENILGSINEYAVSTNLQDKYYLALRIDFDDDVIVGCEKEEDAKNNALIKLDLQNNSFQIMRGVDIKDMLALKAGFEEKIIVTFNSGNKDKIGEITDDGSCFNDILPKYYESNYVMQEDLESVTIRNIVLDASADIDLKIITEQGQYMFKTYCNGINKF
ncbi:MAG: hypothetical protein IJA72_05235, partial [Clostridia bacterium]|nr:hypothetical protein [Clostridia bacterium]